MAAAISPHLVRPGARYRRILVRRRLAVIATVALAWAFVAPAGLGGQFTVVTTVGSSMEPTLHAGDLVVVRRSAAVEPGDVVAYRSGAMGQVVLHRVTDDDGGRYTLKGDNNTWTDRDRPARDDVIGKMALKLPGAGRQLDQLRSPAGLGAAMISAYATAAVRRSRKRARPSPKPSSPSDDRPRLRLDGRAVGTVGALVGLVALVAFIQPTERRSTIEVPFNQRGSFTYSAKAPDAGAVYPGGVVTTGDPIYRRLVDRVDVQYRYGIDVDQPTTASGTIALSLRVEEGNGWGRTIALGDATFDGSTGTAGASIDLAAIGRLLEDAQQLTGVARDSYQVTVIADTTIEGTVGTDDFREDLTARLTFNLDALQLVLADPGRATHEGTSDALTTVEGATLSTARSSDATMSILGANMRVAAVRHASLAALALIGLTAHFFVRRPTGPPPTIPRRLASLVVPVDAMTTDGYAVVDIPLEHLLRLADQLDTPILHQETPTADCYFVKDDGILFRCAKCPAAPPAPEGVQAPTATGTPHPLPRQPKDEQPQRVPA